MLSTHRAAHRMTDSEKLLLFALEAALPHQVEALLSIAGNKGVPLAELVTRGLAENLAGLSEEERLWAKQEFLSLGSTWKIYESNQRGELGREVSVISLTSRLRLRVASRRADRALRTQAATHTGPQNTVQTKFGSLLAVISGAAYRHCGGRWNDSNVAPGANRRAHQQGNLATPGAAAYTYTNPHARSDQELAGVQCQQSARAKSYAGATQSAARYASEAADTQSAASPQPSALDSRSALSGHDAVWNRGANYVQRRAGLARYAANSS